MNFVLEILLIALEVNRSLRRPRGRRSRLFTFRNYVLLLLSASLCCFVYPPEGEPTFRFLLWHFLSDALFKEISALHVLPHWTITNLCKVKKKFVLMYQNSEYVCPRKALQSLDRRPLRRRRDLLNSKASLNVFLNKQGLPTFLKVSHNKKKCDTHKGAVVSYF